MLRMSAFVSLNLGAFRLAEVEFKAANARVFVLLSSRSTFAVPCCINLICFCLRTSVTSLELFLETLKLLASSDSLSMSVSGVLFWFRIVLLLKSNAVVLTGLGLLNYRVHMRVLKEYLQGMLLYAVLNLDKRLLFSQ